MKNLNFVALIEFFLLIIINQLGFYAVVPNTHSKLCS